MHPFLRETDGAVTVDHVTLTGALVGLGIAVTLVVSGGLEQLSEDISRMLSGMEISDSFRTTLEEVCVAAGAGTGPGGAGPTGATYDGMPVNALLIYQSQDFVGGLPDEAGARAAGGAAQSLTLSDTARPLVLFLADDDGALHEVDATQVVAQDITIGGETFAAGYDVSSAYTLTDPGSGLVLSSLHFGDPFSGHWQGPVMATAASNPLEPGETYDFSVNETTHNRHKPYSSYLGCTS